MAKRKHRHLGDPNWRDLMAAVRTTLALWFIRQRTRRHLRNLDARLLQDVGLDEQDRARECVKWPWQGVSDDTFARKLPNENVRHFRARAQLDGTEDPDQVLRRSRTTTSMRAIS